MSEIRERLVLEDNEDNRYLFMDDLKHPEYTFIKEIHNYFDTEKGYSNYKIIIRRDRDGKFFQGERTDWGAGEKEYDFNCKEVFPKQVITTTYE